MPALLVMDTRAEHPQGGDASASTKPKAEGSSVEASKQETEDNGSGRGSEGDETWAVALMFLTTGEEKNAEVWARWLKNAKEGEYNIYVHPKVIIFRTNGWHLPPPPTPADWLAPCIACFGDGSHRGHDADHSRVACRIRRRSSTQYFAKASSTR